jgi:hypothetical protein
MKSWPLSLLLASCAAAPPAAPVATPAPAASREEAIRVLAALERNFYLHWGAVEKTAEVATLRAGHVPFLREIADANGELALMAYRVLRKVAPAETFSEAAKAILYVTAFEREDNFTRWGVISAGGFQPGVYGDELLALRGEPVRYLQKSLRTTRRARVLGTDETERENRIRGDRVCDYAWVILSTLLRRPYAYAPEPENRDPRIHDFDLWLDRRR